MLGKKVITIINDSLGYLLNTSSRLIKRDLDLNLKSYKLTSSQWALLSLLFEEKQISQAEIALRLSSDRATVGSVIDRLLAKGYIKKELSKTDRRSYLISLSPEGLTTINKTRKLGQKSNKKAMQGLTQAQIDTISTSLKLVIENLNKEI